MASCTALVPSDLGRKNGLSGRQNNKEASFMTWKIEFSMGGALLLGRGLR